MHSWLHTGTHQIDTGIGATNQWNQSPIAKWKPTPFQTLWKRQIRAFDSRFEMLLYRECVLVGERERKRCRISKQSQLIYGQSACSFDPLHLPCIWYTRMPTSRIRTTISFARNWINTIRVGIIAATMLHRSIEMQFCEHIFNWTREIKKNIASKRNSNNCNQIKMY